MGEEEKSPNPIYLIPDLVEEIFLGLPLKSIIKFKTVSKQWRSILESRRFAERRMKVQKNRKIILAAGDHRSESRFAGDAEIDMVYVHCDDAATRPSLTCDGLVCIPVPGWINVLNPSTREFIRFPFGPDPVTNRYGYYIIDKTWWNFFPGYWAMGFGRDRVNGSYKVVRMFFDPTPYCEILDVTIGEWRKLVNPPPHTVDARRKSVCVNGSIYWLDVVDSFSLLVLDLHTETFRNVPPPPTLSTADQLINLEDRLAITTVYSKPYWKLEIWFLDAQEETWSMTYTITISSSSRLTSPRPINVWFRPVAISKQGNVFISDNMKRLFKYYPETDMLRYLSQDICVVSSFVENLVPLRPSSVPKTPEYRSGLHYLEDKPHTRISKIFRRIELRIPNILLTTTLVSLAIFRYFVVSARS